MTNVTTLKNQFLNNEHDSTLTDLYYDVETRNTRKKDMLMR